MGKTIKGKEKAKAKVAAAKRKIERKTKRGKIAAIVAAFALAAILTGCTSAQSAQPAKSQTQENRFDGCTFVMAAKTTISNGVIVAEGDAAPALEMFTQTQSLESTGSTDTFGQANTQTPTTDIKPDVDLHYNDAIGAGGSVGASFVNSLTAESAALLKSYIDGKKTGKVTVTTKDGKTETLDCADGTCTTSSGTKITAEDCAACTDCTAK